VGDSSTVRGANSKMSYNNVVGGKLSLKGKALDVKGGVSKKKKNRKKAIDQKLLELQNSSNDAENLRSELAKDGSDGEEHGERGEEGRGVIYEDHRTPAEKVYDEQRTRLEMKRLAKVASKSHRQKIEEFNQYLANLSEHYDIPKVGPG
jgi:protein FAM32A